MFRLVAARAHVRSESGCFLCLAIMFLAACFSTASAAAELRAGGFSFSDELGGFRLVAVSGSGTTSDPVVVVEELSNTGPAILVIRRHDLDDLRLRPLTGRLSLIKHVLNKSGRIWAGFDVELREVREQPSTRQDGLSFNQAGADKDDVASDAFSLNDRQFEPADRITFSGGGVDPDDTLRLRLTITDPTPVAEFYLIQDPNLLSARLRTDEKSDVDLASGANSIINVDTHQLVR